MISALEPVVGVISLFKSRGRGTIYPCHGCNRSGAKAVVDSDFCYKGHTATVISVDFHHVRGPVDLNDSELSWWLDWSYAVGGAGASGDVDAGTAEGSITPLLNFMREDLIPGRVGRECRVSWNSFFVAGARPGRDYTALRPHYSQTRTVSSRWC